MEERIKKVVCETLKIDESAFSVELAAGDIAEWDSLGHVALLQAVESDFGIVFDVGDAIDIESVEDLIVMVRKYTAQTVSDA